MYRLDGIVDRIQYNSSENDKAIEDYQKANKDGTESAVLALSRHFTDSKTQMKVNKVINNQNITAELAAVFRLIDKNLELEQSMNEQGVACHLLLILMCNLKQSPVLWAKLVSIIGNTENHEILEDFNKILKHQSVINCMCEVIEEYLKCLCELGGDFFIDTASITDLTKHDLFQTIAVPQMILVIHHLLSQPRSSQLIADKIFNTFELSTSFISYLKLTLRNLSL